MSRRLDAQRRLEEAGVGRNMYRALGIRPEVRLTVGAMVRVVSVLLREKPCCTMTFSTLTESRIFGAE
jgi:hypothetical protein